MSILAISYMEQMGYKLASRRMLCLFKRKEVSSKEKRNYMQASYLTRSVSIKMYSCVCVSNI
jgi:hypothetical protein